MLKTILPNGNLKLSIENDAERFEISEILSNDHCNDDKLFLVELLEHLGWSTNGGLQAIYPEWISALTDSPMMTDDLTIYDNGDYSVNGEVYWFPDYQVIHFGELLIEQGYVVFVKAS